MRVLPNTELEVPTSKSRSASSWFCMIGRVFRSFSAFMVLITPSILQIRRHMFISYQETSAYYAVSTILYCFKRPKGTPIYDKLNNN